MIHFAIPIYHPRRPKELLRAAAVRLKISAGVGAVVGHFWAVAGVAIATFLFVIARPWFDASQASLLYLPVVIACAVLYGFGPAVLAAALGFFCWDVLFMRPYGSLVVTNPRDWLTLIVFLAAGVPTAHLASRARLQAHRAQEREQETAAICSASQAINTELEVERVLTTLVKQVTGICGCPWCVVIQTDGEDGQLAITASDTPTALSLVRRQRLLDIASSVMRSNRCICLEDADLGWETRLANLGIDAALPGSEVHGIFEPLVVQSAPMGVLCAGSKAAGVRFSAQDLRIVKTLANSAAVVIARQVAADRTVAKERQAAILEERNRLAGVVHDTLSHSFTGIKFLLEAARRIGASPEATPCIEGALELAVEGAQEARQSAWALRPAALERAGGLAGALRRLASTPQMGHTLAIEVTASEIDAAIPVNIEENLLRICHEALTNVHRHAHATKAMINLTQELRGPHSVLVLCIKDNGIGLQANKPTSHGFGINGIRERVREIAGSFALQSSPGKGTEIVVSAPLDTGGEIV